MVGATAWSRVETREDVRKDRELQASSMSKHAARSGRLRNFGSVTHQETVAKYLSERRVTVSRETRERVHKPMGAGTMLLWISVRDAGRE
jgi:hypothetical protein